MLGKELCKVLSSGLLGFCNLLDYAVHTQVVHHAAAGCSSGSCEEWLGWMGACRVGCRKALGYDVKRRRYWALGGSLGAWRVYVEEAEGTLWGWYEGEQSLGLCLLVWHCRTCLTLTPSLN